MSTTRLSVCLSVRRANMPQVPHRTASRQETMTRSSMQAKFEVRLLADFESTAEDVKSHQEVHQAISIMARKLWEGEKKVLYRDHCSQRTSNGTWQYSACLQSNWRADCKENLISMTALGRKEKGRLTSSQIVNQLSSTRTSLDLFKGNSQQTKNPTRRQHKYMIS